MGKAIAYQVQAPLPDLPPPPANYWGESSAFWVQTLMLFIGVAVALWSVIVSRQNARRKAAVEVIFHSRGDKELREAVQKITELSDGDLTMAKHGRQNALNSDEAKALRYALNHYEYISVGIGQSIYDEEIFRTSSFTTITRLYKRTKPFIDELRKTTGVSTIYQEFEELACRWISNPLKKKSIKGFV